MDQSKNQPNEKNAQAQDAGAALLSGVPGEKQPFFSRMGLHLRAVWSEYRYLLIPAGIAVVLVYLMYLARGQYPFGDGCVLVLDLNGQYVSFYHALRDILHGDASLFYTFCRNMGGEFLGIFDYYVASPFAWLVALFPETMMLEALLVLFLLKTALLAFNMGFYLHKTSRGKPNKLAVIAFSLMYALTSYAIVQQHNSMWIDCVLWLPILTYAIEQLIKRGRFRLYVFTLAISIFSNFYIGYMVCIYTVAYCFYYYFAHNEKENPGNNPGGEKNHFAKSVGRVAVWSLLAVGMAALAILSARYSLGFGKDEFSNPSWDVVQKFDLFELFYKFLPSSYDTVRPAGLPIVYCGMLTLILVPAFFMARKISNREKIAAGFFILFFVLSFATSTIDLIWHGFQKPNWLNYRYSFMLSFFLLVIAFRAFEQILFVSRKALFGSTVAIGVLVLVIQEMSDFLVEKNEKLTVRPFATIWLALGCLFIYFILICLSGRVRRAKETVSIVLVFVICVELFLSGLSDMNALDKDVTYSKYSRYNNFLDTFLPIAETIQENDDGFYRTEKTYHRKTNDNFALNFKGLSCSTSTLNRSTIDFLATLGYASMSHWSKYIGGNPVSDSLMGIKYLVTDQDMTVYYGDPIYENEMFLEMYDEDLSVVSNPDVYLNPYALSLAFGVSDDWEYHHSFTVNKDGKKENVYDTPIEQLNQMITVMLGETETVEVFKKAVQEGEPTLTNCTHTSVANHHKYEPEDKDKDAKITYTYTVPADTPLYFYMPSDYPREVKIKVNGTAKGGFNGGSDSTYRCLTSLGSYSADKLTEGLSLELTINNSSNNLYILQSGDYSVYDSYIYYIDWELFTEVMARLDDVQMTIDASSTDDHLTGAMTTTKDSQLVATTIAYDEGWHVYVDGEKVGIMETADALLSFRIEGAGEHTIELKYMPTVVRLGMICSVTCFVIFLLLALAWPVLRKIPLLRRFVEIPGSDPQPEESYEQMYARELVRLGEEPDLLPDDIGAPFKDVPPTDPDLPEDVDEAPDTPPAKAKSPSQGAKSDKSAQQQPEKKNWLDTLGLTKKPDTGTSVKKSGNDTQKKK